MAMNTAPVRSSSILFIITLTLVGALLVVSLLIYLRVQELSESKLDFSQQQELAGKLLDNKLYLQAVAAYQRLLDLGDLPRRRKANINYIVGNIYMSYLNDYENAAARFIQAQLLDPEGELKDKISKNLVICFERMGRSLEAQKQLEKSTRLDQAEKKGEGGVVVARIGDREITLNELENEIEKLPPSVQQQFKQKKKKLDFLKQYVGSELLYHTALRQGLDRDKEVREEVAQFKKQMMINKLLSLEIPQDFEISPDEIKLYYDAHKGEFEGKKLSELKPQIESELKKMKQKEAYDRLIRRMMQAEKVKIFDDRFN